MKLDFLNLEDLKTSAINVRKHGEVNGDDLIPSIKANGIIQPLLVRPNGKGYEIIAGQRRYKACLSLAKKQEINPIPCAIMDDGDDAKAIEASLTENLARLPMDELDQYDAFQALVRSGRTVDEIADHFGVTTRLVEQRLAIAKLYTPILNAYRKGEIQASTIRQLTMASTKQQKDWFKLFGKDKEPPHWQLKSWLFGGDEIPTQNALFDLDVYTGVVTTDLFGEDQYFADSKVFWEFQSRAIAELKTELEEDGWSEVILLDVGERWQRWDYVDWDKDQGGKVFIEVNENGEVTVHKGLIHQKQARRLENGEAMETLERPELTKPMQNFLELHRHAAVRTVLLGHQGVALRLATAQIIAGSTLMNAYADPRKANTDKIKESLASNKAESVFAKERQHIKTLLELDKDDTETVVPMKSSWDASLNLHAIFAKLLFLDDDSVNRVLTFVIAETLPAGTAIVEVLGNQLNVVMKDYCNVEEADIQTVFLDLLRDKEAINSTIEEIVGKDVALVNMAETAKSQKQVIQNCLTGQREMSINDWQPRYMAFPMQGYTNRQKTILAIKEWESVKHHYQAA